MPYTDEDFKAKLRRTQPTEKSIASTTKYIIHNRKFYKNILKILLGYFKKLKAEKRLTIIYILNHTLQEAKKTKPGLEKLFGHNIEVFFEYYGNDKKMEDRIFKKVNHVLQIWKDREVFASSKVETLQRLFSDNSFRKKWHKKNKLKRENQNLFGKSKPESHSRRERESKVTNNERPSRESSKQKSKSLSYKSERSKWMPNGFQGTPDGEPNSFDFNENDNNKNQENNISEEEIELESRNLFDDGVVQSKKLIVKPQENTGIFDKQDSDEFQLDSDTPVLNDSAVKEAPELNLDQEETTNNNKNNLNISQKSQSPSKSQSPNKSKIQTKQQQKESKKSSRKRKSINKPITNYSKILRTSLTSETSIHHDLEWLDCVPDEISNLNDGYINPAVIKMNINLAVSPKVFSDKMTAVLKAPPSLDSETRTWLTNLPAELSDPQKIDDLVKQGIEIQRSQSPDRTAHRNMVQKIGNIFKDIQEFKTYLSNYNQQLQQELVQRRDLGCYCQLLAKERKKSHKYYIDKVKLVTKRKGKANENAEKLQLMCSEPKLPEVSDTLPDVGQLFENENSYNR